MKLLLENKRCILLISLTIFIVFCAHISSYADENSAPVFVDGNRATRSVAENTPTGTNIGAPVAATDADGDTLTYSKGWVEGAGFSIDSTTGQLRTKAPLDYETKNQYSLAVFANDGNGGRIAIPVTINITDVDETPVNNAPIFTDGDSTTRSIAENTAAGESIGTAVAATDVDANTTLTYSLGGTDTSAFSIVSTTGQLQTSAALDYETKTSYSVTVSVSDGSLSDSIPVTISVSNVNEAPNFTDGDSTTRSVAENTAAGESIGTAVAATDVDANTTLTYSLDGTDASAFRINGTTGQLQTNVALDYETKSSYSVTVSVSDGNGESDSISLTINVTDVGEKPVFAPGGVTLTIAENTASDTNIGKPITATDPDSGDTLTYSLRRGDADSFSIDATTGQVRTKTALDYETKNAYTDLVVRATDSTGLIGATRVTINVTDVDENRAPEFSRPYRGDRTSRSVAENTASGENIGEPFTATDADNDTLTYTLVGPDASSFSIVSPSGQLKTKVALDYETKSAYVVVVIVSDGNGGRDGVTVTINITDVDENRAPVFADGDSTTRTIAENTASGENIGTALAATDADTDDTLTYTLGGTDAESFSIVSTTGQLQTNAALDYETKTSYSVAVSVSDGNGGTDSITVTINVTDVNEYSPVFTDGNSATRTVAENTAANTNIGSAVAATDADTGDVLTYTLGGTNAAAFSINSTTGQLRTRAALDYETKSSYSVTVSVSDGNGESNSIPVTITVTDVSEKPSFGPDRIRRTVSENAAPGTKVGDPITAIDPDTGDTLTYSLRQGWWQGEADSFRIDANTGQVYTKVALDYETQQAYDDLVVRATDSTGLSGAAGLIIRVTEDNNSAPVFTDGTVTARSVAENTASGENIGSAVAATDADNDTLTYSLSGTDAEAFSIVSTTGQLQTNADLDYETKTSYSQVMVSVSDGKGGTDSIIVPITVTDVSENPVFALGDVTLTIAENTDSGTNIGDPITATDPDSGDTLTYALRRSDAESFSIDPNTGQLRTKADLDYETKNAYTDLAVRATDSTGLTGATRVTITVTDVGEKPVFALEDVTLTVSENADSGTNIGTPITATDPDSGDTLTYSLRRGDKDAFSIDPNTGQLRTKADLDYETKNAYTDLAVRATDSTGLTGSTRVTINVTDGGNRAPVFTDGDSTTRSIAENTASGENIGNAFAATDADNDTLTYSLSGTDAAAFSIVSTTGQLQTNADLDYETKSSYSVTVSVSDGNGGSDSIAVTINVTNANDSPVFTEGDSTTWRIEEYRQPGSYIAPIAATDADNDVLTYSLGGTDAAAFSIISTTGYLRTNAALDYETKSSYSVTVSVSDGNGGTDSIDVTITVIDTNDSPVFTDGDSTTRSVAEDTPAGINIGTPVAAIDQDDHHNLHHDDINYDPLYYTLSGRYAARFSIGSTTGQLQTKDDLDYETKTSYSVTITVSDGNGGSDSIDVTINVTDVNEVPGNNAPVFPDGNSTTRSVAEYISTSTNVGTPVAATDADNDTLTYSLGGTDGGSFNIDSTTGQLQTNADLDYERKHFEGKFFSSVTVAVSDGNGGTDSIDVMITVTDVNEAPEFTEGDSTTRSVAEDTLTGINIGTLVAATDPEYDTLTYTLGGTDAATFSIGSTTGQLQTNAALDYETKTSYSVTITASDGTLTDSIDVTINVTDVNENKVPGNNAPVFTQGDSTTRSVAENTQSGGYIGHFATTDADNDVLTYSLGGTDAASFSINSDSGSLYTSADLDYETKNAYSVTVYVSDGNGGSDSITVTIDVLDVNEAPVFTEGLSTTFSIAENTASGVKFGDPFTTTDPENDRVIYGISHAGGNEWSHNHDSFSIDRATGQLQTREALDYETQSFYPLTVSASDRARTSIIRITVTIIDVNEAPEFPEGESTTRSVLADALTGSNIGLPVEATDPEYDVLTYTLSGTDAAPFSIDSTTGQLQTNAALDFDGQTSYAVTITASDGTFTDNIDVTIVANNPPVFTDGESVTLSVREIYDSRTPAVTATDADGDTLTYTLSGTDASLFYIYIYGTAAYISMPSGSFDYETKSSYSVTVAVSDGNGGTDSIDVTINVTDMDDPAEFIDGDSTTRTVAENTPAGINIGAPVAATDPDGNPTIYSFSPFPGNPDHDAFSVNSTTGQIQTKADLDYETKNAYQLTLWGESRSREGGGQIVEISVTINVTDVNEVPGNNAPVFPEGESTTRAVAEDALIGANIGTAVAATDADNDTLTYSLGGMDPAPFSLDSTTGQIQTNTVLDYETKTSYSVRVAVSDSKGGTDSIDITINVTDVDEPNNDPPTFIDGSSTTRTVAENTASGENIGTPVAATDSDPGDTLTYTLNDTYYAALFSIDSTTGQLQTKAALDYETGNRSWVTVSVSDGNGGTDSIDVTINITDVVDENAPAAPSVETSPLMPANTELLTNFPNPFNPETWIPYQLAKPAEVTLTIYDIRGVVVRRLKLGYQAAGFYQNRSRAIHWDGRNNIGEKVASGVYFYTLTADEFTATRKLLIRK